MRKVMIVLLSCVLIIALCICGVLLYWSIGRSKSCIDNGENENCISEKISVDINGAKQGMFIRGTNINNPVLLFVHGGPIMPEYFLQYKYPTGLEKYFTVCWWEQRGVGLSYDSNLSKEDFSVDTIVDDTIGVTNYLRQRFNKDKVYLLGHSWGTFIGIQAAYKNPELYNAYIGMGQIVNQAESEKEAYDYMLNEYSNRGNSKMVKALKKYDINKNDEELLKYFKSSLRDKAMHELGIGTMHNMNSVITGIFLPVMQCKDYTLTERINIWRGKGFVKKNTSLIEDYLFDDISSRIEELKVPCYFVSGKYDYTVSKTMAQDYLNKLKAPKKEFCLCENSAHSPMFEERDRFVEFMSNKVLS